MLLSEHKVRAFMEALSSAEPAPGGGSASALAGALGAALIAMAANLTAGREKFRDREQRMRDILREADAIKDRLMELIDEDTEAFNAVTAVFAMPKNSEEEKALRRKAMDEALKHATRIPFAVMEESVKALEVLRMALGSTNPAADSDLGVSALCLKAALQGAWLNILTNLGGIRDDAFTEKYRSQAEEILGRGLPLADLVSLSVERSLGKG